MTLAQWAAEWPYAVAIHANGLSWTPDRTGVETHRTKAWGLSDFRVWKVSGGSIWFMPRDASEFIRNVRTVRRIKAAREAAKESQS